MDAVRFATYLAPNLQTVYQRITTYVGQRLRIPTELRVDAPKNAFERGVIDVAFICGLPYVRLAQRPNAQITPLVAPILQGERYQHRPIYFSDVIVSHDSTCKVFADLRGHSWAYNVDDSQSGYGITRYTLVQMGATHGFFGHIVAAGWHEVAIQLVATGQVDASAIDSQTLAVALRDHPELSERLRVIDSLGPSTIQPLVASMRLSLALREDIRAALRAMGSDDETRATLDLGFITRFTPICDADYDDIRAMESAAISAGLTTLR